MHWLALALALALSRVHSRKEGCGFKRFHSGNVCGFRCAGMLLLRKRKVEQKCFVDAKTCSMKLSLNVYVLGMSEHFRFLFLIFYCFSSRVVLICFSSRYRFWYLSFVCVQLNVLTLLGGFVLDLLELTQVTCCLCIFATRPVINLLQLHLGIWAVVAFLLKQVVSD